jgi:hypothetical protein
MAKISKMGTKGDFAIIINLRNFSTKTVEILGYDSLIDFKKIDF